MLKLLGIIRFNNCFVKNHDLLGRRNGKLTKIIKFDFNGDCNGIRTHSHLIRKQISDLILKRRRELTSNN